MVASAKTTVATVAAVLAIVIILLAVFPPNVSYLEIDGDHAGDSYMIWSLAAPIIAIGLALITKRVYTSLFVGVLSGVLIFSHLDLLVAFQTLFTGDLGDNTRGFAATLGDVDNIGICIFLIILGAFVFLMRRAGGTAALAVWARGRLKTREQSQLMTMALGVIIFIDDYFNCLTVGTVMKPVTDEHRVSRAKLAYLIDATAAPICIIAPVSSWAGAVSGYIEGKGALETFINTIPYNFYALLTIVFVIALILLKFDFGPMRRYEANAIEKGDLFSGGMADRVVDNDISEHEGTVMDLIVPILILVACSVLGMLYTGYISGAESLYAMISDCDACIGLPLGAFFAFMITLAFLYYRKAIVFDDVWKSVPEGFKAMFPAILILILAWTLKGTIDLMGADLYVADLVQTYAVGLEYLIPILVFVVAMFLGFSTGTSWGTFGILIPICMALFVTDPIMMVISMSACMAGAVFGDHCSPISDTTIMASTGADCDLVTHVSTQLPYAVVVASVSAVCFLIAGLLRSPWIPLAAGVVMIVAVLFVIRAVVGKNDVTASE
ncbi:MAG: Na+/H+ antiporter NhaC family protein [Candidatus Methanomethylophilaceae archaeon]|nr:Na+/H+ antiporter NhaC family protein [Candidatus Methanomethylophilaceae archaeon]